MDIADKLNFDVKTTQKVVKLIAEIEKFQGKWEALEFQDSTYLNELRHIATIQSIGSSTRIEGSALSDVEVRDLIDNLQINNLEKRDEQEVVGYWRALELILEQAEHLKLSENYITQIHSLLLKYSKKDERQRGKYKNLTNKVVANYPDGTQRTIFNTTEPHLVSKEMSELVDWTNGNLESDDMNPIIVIATFVYEILSIHPFHDGNGRLSRLLTTLLLVKEKYFFVQYVSFEHAIEDRKKDYYQALMECQRNRNTDEESIGSWVIFFLECMISLSNKLENKIEVISHQGKYLSQRQKNIVSILSSGIKLKVSDIHTHFLDVTIHTIKKDLLLLVSEGVIQKSGVGKGTIYHIDLLEV